VESIFKNKGIIKHKVLWYWMSELSSMICSWDALLFDEGILKHDMLLGCFAI
jgi:hypothetical protein